METDILYELYYKSYLQHHRCFYDFLYAGLLNYIMVSNKGTDIGIVNNCILTIFTLKSKIWRSCMYLVNRIHSVEGMHMLMTFGLHINKTRAKQITCYSGQNATFLSPTTTYSACIIYQYLLHLYHQWVNKYQQININKANICFQYPVKMLN